MIDKCDLICVIGEEAWRCNMRCIVYFANIVLFKLFLVAIINRKHLFCNTRHIFARNHTCWVMISRSPTAKRMSLL